MLTEKRGFSLPRRSPLRIFARKIIPSDDGRMKIRIIKRLDLYILQNFALVFAGSFFICLFVFMMQFTWRYVNELIGKGLSLEILAKFFGYMAVTLIPQSLPLAVLLASLIAFGNMGERLELLAMKAAGVPLVRIMRPILVVVVAFGVGSFFFQNTASPKAQRLLRTLIISMKQTSPAVEIPEGVFYNGVPDVNLYVQRKNAETGMLYQLIIYKTDQGFDKAQIVLADSGKMEVTADRMHLKLKLWSGEQFENLQGQSFTGLQTASVPYDRETFNYKELLIAFDSNFNLMDANALNGLASAKDMHEIVADIDSVEQEMDSVGRSYYAAAQTDYFTAPRYFDADSTEVMQRAVRSTVSFDTIVAQTPPERLVMARRSAMASVQSFRSELEWKSLVTGEGDRYVRTHWIEWHQKMTLSLACVMFFFVGAPLGAIIRKGGLGMPTVISVVIFIFYYIFNTSGMKLARDGSWNIWYGMWISTMILSPIGAFLTYKANKDSVVFNFELYVSFFRQLLGLRSHRHVFRKEVIIDDPDYATMPRRLGQLRQACTDYLAKAQLLMAPNYVRIFFRYVPDRDVQAIDEEMEKLVEELSNSRNPRVLAELNHLPILYANAHTSPFHNKAWNVTAGLLLPVGLVLWLRMWHFRLRLGRDLKQIVKSSDNLIHIISDSELTDKEKQQNDGNL